MARKHLSSAGSAKCGASVIPARLTDRASEVSCIACRRAAGLTVAPKAVEMREDWGRKCSVCGNRPVIHGGLCGPCLTGDASTVGGSFGESR